MKCVCQYWYQTRSLIGHKKKEILVINDISICFLT